MKGENGTIATGGRVKGENGTTATGGRVKGDDGKATGELVSGEGEGAMLDGTTLGCSVLDDGNDTGELVSADDGAEEGEIVSLVELVAATGRASIAFGPAA